MIGNRNQQLITALVNRIEARDRVSLPTAFLRAAKERPDLFAEHLGPKLKPFLNHDASRFAMPSDGWIQLVPRGEFPIQTADGGLVQVIDDAALKSFAGKFAPDAGRLLVDFDHFSYDSQKSSEAAGWIDAVEVRADGLWGKPRWSDAGQTAVSNGRYRFLSPAWQSHDVERIGPGRIRPLRIDSVGLTNQPNMRGMVPLTNSAAAATRFANADLLGETILRNTLPRLRPRLASRNAAAGNPFLNRQKVEDWESDVRHAMASLRITAEDAWHLVKGRDQARFVEYVEAAMGNF
ncbi:MAG: phage protease [Chthoniobacter sp.]|nr:phage protease [Chthoniobacter sp.]